MYAQLFPTGETPKNITRSSTPTTPAQAEGSSAESTAADDALLRQYAAVIADAKLLQSQTWELWRDEVSLMLAPFREESSTEHSQAEGMYPLRLLGFIRNER